MKERLQKILSSYGIASRRQAEKHILDGLVKVNGKVAQLGDSADEAVDEISFKNKRISKEETVYYIVNKPAGYTCSVSDRHADALVTHLVPRKPKVWPVGRLDKESSGLIVLTNDGELTNILTHPKFAHEKEYLVQVNSNLEKFFVEKMKKGIHLEEGVAKADKISIMKPDTFKIVMHQGWKRQIRRMCSELGYLIINLKRVRIGNLRLGSLKEGAYLKVKDLNI